MIEKLRNIAIIAHVDHGKTTLVDKLLQQSGTLAKDEALIMDSGDLERERGITITAKNTAITWQDYRINIVDTPGHADFGGEVERILSMVDAVLLIVDAVDGPMPQTRFVTQKAFKQGLNPIVVVNKIDRSSARPDWVIDQVFDLFSKLGATEAQLDFPIIYTSALQGFATLDPSIPSEDMTPLFQMIVNHVSPPPALSDGPLQMQISSLDYSTYLGVIGIGRIRRGTLAENMAVVVLDRESTARPGRVLKIWTFKGLERIEVPKAFAGDIVAVAGIEDLTISDTICLAEAPEILPPLSVDQPTISMVFQTNTSPFVGKEGTLITSRVLKERLEKEAIHNIALRVEPTEDPNKFSVSGRGELHLGILLETMRREGFELAVSPPKVILQEIDGQLQEPYERLVADVEEAHQGAIIQYLGERRGEMVTIQPDSQDRVRLEYIIAARGLIGFHTEFMSLTSGTGILTHTFDHYGPVDKRPAVRRKAGTLIANAPGKATAYSLMNVQQRGQLFIEPQTDVYEGMVVGIHSRENDLVVNVIKGKQLTNMRASGSDGGVMLAPPIKLTMEYAFEFIEGDELVEITPQSIRIRKKFLTEHERKKKN